MIGASTHRTRIISGFNCRSSLAAAYAIYSSNNINKEPTNRWCQVKRVPPTYKIAPIILHAIDGVLASNRCRIIRLYVGWTCLVHRCAVLNYFWSLPEVASDVIYAVHL